MMSPAQSGSLPIAALLLSILASLWAPRLHAQDTEYDPSWYDADRPYVKVAVTEDGVYQITGADLEALSDVSLASIAPGTLRLVENGRDVPLHYLGDANAMTSDARILFVGHRNRGTDETWAYNYTPEWQSSTYNSLFTDTTYYWLTWGGDPGLRYAPPTPPPPFQGTTTFRDTLYYEPDQSYYAGDGESNQENPLYTRGEGYYTRQRFFQREAGTQEERFTQLFLDNIARPSAATDTIYVSVRLNGASPTPHRVALEAETVVDGVEEYREYASAEWVGYAFQTIRAAIPASHFPSGRRLFVKAISTNEEANGEAPLNRIQIDWVRVAYTRELVAANGALDFAVPGGQQRRNIFSGFGDGETYIFNPRDRIVHTRQTTDGTFSFSASPPSPVTYWVANASALRAPAAFQVDRSSDWASPANEADYVIITAEALRSSAEALADYRRAHNDFQVAIVNVQDVYDQFDYGRPTPIAIRRFVHASQRWRIPPRFLVLWGDALYPRAASERPPWEVISYGRASSDGWFAMQGNGRDDWTEVLAIGRVTLRSNDDGATFLQKLQTYEAAPLEPWKKEALMMVGSRFAAEQAALKSHIDRWSGRALAPPTGMDTTRFIRTITDELPPDASLTGSIRTALKSGASWLTYFGHSAATTWDIVVDPPAEFDNAGRLPLALSLGCRTGAFAGGRFTPSDVQVLAEQLVVGSPNGSIGHWGTSGLSSVSAAVRLGDEVHELVFGDTLRTIGYVFQEAKRRYATSGAFSRRDILQFGLIGDPATRLNVPDNFDFRLRPERVRIEPLAPIPADSQLTVTVTPENLGLVPPDSLPVRLTHTTPDGTTATFNRRAARDRIEDDLSFAVPINDEMAGTNQFSIALDPDGSYPEVSELNNTVETSHVIFSTALELVAPANLSAVSGPPLSLRVAFLTRGDEGTAVDFALDTSPSFDSPDLRRFETTTDNDYAVWEITDALPAGQRYFWRARIDDPEEVTQWQEATFFLNASDQPFAWTQSGTLFDRNSQSETLQWTGENWALGNYDVEVQATAAGREDVFKGQFVVNGTRYERLSLGYGFLVLDGNSGSVVGHAAAPTYENTFVDPDVAYAQLDSVTSLAKQGDYVFTRARNIANRGGPEIQERVKDLFRQFGSTAIDTLTYREQFVMFARVGYPEETRELVAPRTASDLVLDTVLTFQHPTGITASPAIGPTRSWRSLSWEAALPNAASSVQVDVLDAQTDSVLIGGLTVPGQTTDLSSIDARQVPLLRLQATLTDTTHQATPQLTRWSVDFAYTPEILFESRSITLSADTLNEGASLTTSGTVRNLSDQVADTLLLHLRLTDADNRTTAVATDTLTNLVPDSTATSTFSLGTEGRVGTNRLTFEVEQPGLQEPLTFNNVGFSEFTVLGDRQAPVLDVLVEGTAFPHNPEPVRDLQSPDIPQVSPQPTIEITLSDENPFKLLQDTSLIEVTLENVTTATVRPIPFSSPNVQFEPATEEENEARIVYAPDFSGQDAVFTLRVEAFDVAGNEAEGSPYQVHFRVQTTFEMSSLYPYPNPMSDFTRFAFELKGSDPTVVEDLRIRIYTLSGRIIREFDVVENPSLLDSGGLRIGWNKLTWDGTDEDGDPLATGVYLYKVLMRAEGQQIEVNNDAGLEKLVVLR